MYSRRVVEGPAKLAPLPAILTYAVHHPSNKWRTAVKDDGHVLSSCSGLATAVVAV